MSADDKKFKALDTALDAVKFTLGLATGALVFSVELLKEQIKLTTFAKCFLLTSWTLFAISIVAGLFVFFRVPKMIEANISNLADPLFERPGKLHHVAFLFAVLALGVAMVIILAGKTDLEKTPSKTPALPTLNKFT